ncbi:hypothetical protein [Actinomadura sp. WAC 06369]|uniref:hypothetical protein n=1 Tax=Actinomadura sp. WAC 06369 TaxID=2203193 RepID=UPI000F77354C|nr:hypothetical protein [Actinomadura sp. WAC 06369]
MRLSVEKGDARAAHGDAAQRVPGRRVLRVAVDHHAAADPGELVHPRADEGLHFGVAIRR